MTGPQRDNADLKREEIENPTERNAADHKRGEQLRAKSELFLRLVAHQRAEDDRDEQREDDHQPDVRGAHLRPCAMSKASSTTSMFIRPETMRKALPYS